MHRQKVSSSRIVASAAVIVIVGGVTAAYNHTFPFTSGSTTSLCTEVNEKIREEEKVGKILWETYEASWQDHQKQVDGGDANFVTNSLINVFESDKQIYDLAKKHPECYTAEKNAAVRTDLAGTELAIKNLRTWLNSGKAPATDYYPGYASFFDPLTPTPKPTFRSSDQQSGVSVSGEIY